MSGRSPLLIAVVLLGACACSSSEAGAPADDRRVIEIHVDAAGYHPTEARAAAGQPVRLVFTRTTDEGCGQQLMFPDLDIRRDLPLNEPVPVDITMPASGAVRFACGMDMYRGSVVAE